MAHPNRSQTDDDEIQKLISQYFPQPELLANHPPGTQADWEQQQQQKRQRQRQQQQRQQQQRQQEQKQQQKGSSRPSRPTFLPQQQSLSPQYTAQPWIDLSTTLESRMPPRYPQDRSLPEQCPFQDLMRVIQDEQAAAALPGPSSYYNDSQPNVNRLLDISGSENQSTPGAPTHTVIEPKSSTPPTGMSLYSGPCPSLPYTQTLSPLVGPQDELSRIPPGVLTLPQTRQGSTCSSTASPWQGSTNEDDHFQMYECGICIASFSRKHDMERHRRTHTGEAPYGCEGCGAMFTRSDGRGRHFKIQPECEAAHYAKSQGKPKRKGSLAVGSGDGFATSETRMPKPRGGSQ